MHSNSNSLKFQISSQEIAKEDNINRISYLTSKVISLVVLRLTMQVKLLAIPDYGILRASRKILRTECFFAWALAIALLDFLCFDSLGRRVKVCGVR